ncbi:MAG: hypothetical protein ACTSR2_11455 [Candidatus Hodarchaeales archaeon]
MTSQSGKIGKIDTFSDIISSLETTAQIKPEISQYTESLIQRLMDLTRDYYASIVFLFTTPLSYHRRLILMELIAIYPQGVSGIDLARTLGISVKSKSIYRDLKALEKLGFVRLDEIHSRLKLAYANADNRLINRLIELVGLHGKELQKIIRKEAKE